MEKERCFVTLEETGALGAGDSSGSILKIIYVAHGNRIGLHARWKQRSNEPSGAFAGDRGLMARCNSLPEKFPAEFQRECNDGDKNSRFQSTRRPSAANFCRVEAEGRYSASVERSFCAGSSSLSPAPLSPDTSRSYDRHTSARSRHRLARECILHDCCTTRSVRSIDCGRASGVLARTFDARHVHTGCLETAEFSRNISRVSYEISRVYVQANSSKLVGREFSSATLQKLFGASSDISASKSEVCSAKVSRPNLRFQQDGDFSRVL